MTDLPFLTPLRDVFAARTGAAAARAAATILTAALVLTSALLLLASGLAALTGPFGFPVAALAMSALVWVLALLVHLIGQAFVAHRMTRVAAAQSRTEADFALAVELSRSARPLLPLAAFLAAFFVVRRS